MPSPVKSKPGIKPAFDDLEELFFRELEIETPILTDSEEDILKLADNLEGALFCISEVYRGNRNMLYVLDNYLAYINEHAPTGVAHSIYTRLKENRDEFTTK
jgi:5'-deoxynucleotidase YfbR-like HD superfamily hydrolase